MQQASKEDIDSALELLEAQNNMRDNRNGTTIQAWREAIVKRNTAHSKLKQLIPTRIA